MWYFHKKSGVAFDLNQVRLLSCSPDAMGGPAIYFFFLDNSNTSHTFQDAEQMQAVFDEITERL